MKLEKLTKSQQAQSFAIRASRWASICSLSHVRKSSFGSVAAGSFAFCMWTSNCPLWAAKASGISSSGRCKQSQTRKRSLVSKINKADLRHVCYQSLYKPRQKSRCFAGRYQNVSRLVLYIFNLSKTSEPAGAKSLVTARSSCAPPSARSASNARCAASSPKPHSDSC